MYQSVEAKVERTITHRINLTATLDDVSTNDTIEITLNGRVIKRLNTWQAERFGICISKA